MDFDYNFDKNLIFLVTGGAGFIGSNICHKLIELGGIVRCLDNLTSGSLENIHLLEATGRFHFIQGDIRDFAKCNEACKGVDFILHNAALSSVAESMDKPELYEEVNVIGTENLLKAAVKNGVKRFVYASSAAVYGDSTNRVAVEGEEGNPLSVYAETKAKNEQQAKYYKEKYGLVTFGLRYFNVYGRRQRYDSPYSAVIPKFMSGLLKKEIVRINGDGEQTRDFVYVDDVVQANLKACLADAKYSGRVFNIACGEETSVLKLYKSITDVLETDQQPVFAPAVQGEVRFSKADILRAKEELGYNPQYSFEKGIAASVEWYKENI